MVELLVVMAIIATLMGLGMTVLPAMMQRLGPRVHFLHLRNVRREGTALRDSFLKVRI